VSTRRKTASGPGVRARSDETPEPFRALGHHSEKGHHRSGASTRRWCCPPIKRGSPRLSWRRIDRLLLFSAPPQLLGLLEVPARCADAGSLYRRISRSRSVHWGGLTRAGFGRESSETARGIRGGYAPKGSSLAEFLLLTVPRSSEAWVWLVRSGRAFARRG